jgi:hypothetical protein
MNIKDLWNSQADHQNQWDSLGEDEKLEFVAAHEREECAKVCELQDGAGLSHEHWWECAAAIRARSKA